jgi:argininosuccinate synthase
MQRIVLAYSGGLDTSIAIPWLVEHYDAEVVAVTMDLGQGSELDETRDRALAAGAIRAHVLDVREEFARDYILPVLQADAIYDNGCPVATMLGRPLIARKLVEIAAIEQAVAVAHGCGGDNDPMNLDVAVRALSPVITVIAPARDWRMTPSEKIDYARMRGIPLSAGTTGYRTHTNLWGRSVECEVEDPPTSPPEQIYTLTRRPADCPNEAAYAEMNFERGVPTAINGVAMPLVELIASLTTIASAHGVGRIDIVANRLGVTSREIYEMPAAIVLHKAHKELQRMVTTSDAERLSDALSRQYADVIHDGLWFMALREALDACVAKVQERVSGVIRLKLFKGDCHVVGRKSPFALYDQAQATYDAADAFNHTATAGLTRISGRPGPTAARQA